MKLGDAFFTAHLWIVCSEPTPQGEVVIFNLTTRKSNSDLNCVVLPSEHPFVKQESVIAYERGQLMDSQQWASVQKLGKMYPPVSKELLLKIQQGALRSDLTPQKLQRIIQQQLLSGTKP